MGATSGINPEFQPAVRGWFEQRFGRPTAAQAQAWPAIYEGRDTLIAAPTGSGKTLAAFLAAIDALVREGLTTRLPDETRVLYVSPLKALSNDVQKNLQEPLAGIAEQLRTAGLPQPDIRAWVRTGDTPQSERARMRREPPHILVTTPESLYLMLTAESGREMLAGVRSVIVDEVHALAGNKRGAHLSLSLARLDALVENRLGKPPTRIGLSATQKPIATMAAFLTGRDAGRCNIVDTGYTRDRDLSLCVPGAPLSAVMSNDTFGEIYDQLAGLIEAHKTTLIFVNTRRLAERAARHLAERLGEDAITAHHGSLAREHRLEAERRLKNGELRALVATAALELGIDIGAVDLVCQLGSPRAIATLLQRVGRSGHAVSALPKGRLFPLSRDDLAECTALLDAVRRGELDVIRIPVAPLDVLAQQIVAEVAAVGECEEAALYDRCITAWPYRDLTREAFTATVRMLADGVTTRRGRRAAHIHRDAVNARLRPRKSARLTALTNGGVIPDQFDYEVILSPAGLKIGSLNEDFAFESLVGDIFQLGNTSYRILKIESGRVFVEDAKGQPPNIPFWFGEAPGRTDELSAAVSRLRVELEQRLTEGVAAACGWLEQELRIPVAAAAQLADYYGAARAALGALPTQWCIVFERFFDEVGDMHLIVHSPFGSRLNRAWGLALRKRFCRKFNFELQAAALEDSIVLSLGATHSFVLEEVAGYLRSATVRDVLTQATLDAPMFGNRWRWNATIALAVRRNFKGKRTPAQFQRSDAEDLLAVVFPDQLACAENLAGARVIPNHPLVDQTLADCLQDTMDIEGLEALLKRLEAGEIEVIGRDLPTPSPLAEEIINARNYAFLDDGAQEERRTLAVRSGGYWSAEEAGQAQLDSAAIERVREEAWPDPRDADELHDALVVHGFLTRAEGEQGGRNPAGLADDLSGGWPRLFETLCVDRRAACVTLPGGQQVWVAAERLIEFQVLFADLKLAPQIEPVLEGQPPADLTEALRELLRSRLEGLGPVTLEQLTAPLGLPEAAAAIALAQLEAEGFAIQGCFGAAATSIQWCERRLLARIHRYTLQRRRREIEPVSPQDYMRFLLGWHGLLEGTAGGRAEGVGGLVRVLAMLEGFSLPAAAWESDVLPARVADYNPQMLDTLCTSGRIAWLRLNASHATNGDGKRRVGPVRNTPIALIERPALRFWQELVLAPPPEALKMSASARKLLEVLDTRGASFFHELQETAGLLRTQAEDGLAELAAWGLASADSFAGLRALLNRSGPRPAHAPRTRIRRRRFAGLEEAGRWSRLRTVDSVNGAGRLSDSKTLEHIAWTLLSRYGVVFKRILERESSLPAWRELLYIYRRLEARGEIRGGRFVAGFAGEQFAAPEAVAALRKTRKAEFDGAWVSLSAADPLNLVGIVTPGQRLPAVPGNRVLLRDGLPVAFCEGGEVRFVGEYEPETQWKLRNHLLRHARPAKYRHEARLST
ncbi:DEAD/DEAH box helicase [Nitrococcus mobilis]|uniref:Probable ATP-dependent DNA helicase n=1 Tax=Nitrococcus mobilis Nb-231 TaxID=314278 RepID=A4BMP7_9GAMM|nr:DEAD/DEAH box helicase [Nitrococcus mobilis]EAR23585.1 probable ATP-dependent DNA helicase [Nitrococcus mobilis Nb-231]